MGVDAPEALGVQPGLEVHNIASNRFRDARGRLYASQSYQPRQSGRSARYAPKIVIFLVAGLLILVTVAAGAVGGLGVMLSSYKTKIRACEANSPAKSPTNSSTDSPANSTTPDNNAILTDYSPVNASRIQSLHNDCDPHNTPQDSWGNTYAMLCGKDMNTRYDILAAQQGGHVYDIASIVAYSLMDCLDACSSLTARSRHSGAPVKCYGITFRTDLNNVTYSENCWLKNATIARVEQALTDPSAHSAQRVQFEI